MASREQENLHRSIRHIQKVTSVAHASSSSHYFNIISHKPHTNVSKNHINAYCERSKHFTNLPISVSHRVKILTNSIALRLSNYPMVIWGSYNEEYQQQIVQPPNQDLRGRPQIIFQQPNQDLRRHPQRIVQQPNQDLRVLFIFFNKFFSTFFFFSRMFFFQHF